MRRIVLSNIQLLRVTNRRDSVGIDSLSSAAPPCYTSQRDETSSVATMECIPITNDYDEDEYEDQGSMSMHSCPEVVPDVGALPSPYSTEDLGLTVDHQVEEQTHPSLSSVTTHSQSCSHVYTHMHSQCTSSTPPLTSDTQHSSTPTRSSGFSNPQPTSPYSYHPPTRYARHSSTPTSPYVSYRGLPRTSEPSSPRILYHHPPLSQPAGIERLTYRHDKTNYEVYHDANDELFSDDEQATQVQSPPMDSTATFLPEGTSSPTPHLLFRSQPDLTSVSHQHPDTTRTARSPSSPQIHSQPTLSRATNYVSLSRKSTLKKLAFFRKPAMSSSITGKFTIDPGLYIPAALLKAVESPSKILPDILPERIDTTKLSSKVPFIGDLGGTKPRKKNLFLEVENGGIDVDVHLVPSPETPVRRLTTTASPVMHVAPTNVLTSPTRLSLDKHYLSEEAYGRPSLSQRQSGRRSVDVQAYPPPPMRKYAPSTPSPTLIDLRLTEIKASKARGSSGTKKGKQFPLIARIHAPNPRPPFHLLASTIDVPASATSNHQTSNANDKPSPPLNHTSPTRPVSSLSRSPLTLHLPPTFRGPLTVHIAAGNIDTHVRLSKGLTDASVVLTESAFSRGYFVGKLSVFGEREDLGADWMFMSDDDGLRTPVQEVPRSMRRGEFHHDGLAEMNHERQEGDVDDADRAAGADMRKNMDLENQEDEEWNGDKIDVFVGNGKVYLQFLGEDDPFGRKGRFWNKLRVRWNRGSGAGLGIDGLD
ncbi:hypothetical protein BDZ97DRAFT_1762993 [Flammula alnicola]|nr:hypothetical protein BDZ97DRAFT_1762993 [Flammula alnicola]